VLKSRPGHELTELELLDREIDPDFLGDKYARLDILGRTATEILINTAKDVVPHDFTPNPVGKMAAVSQ
jgi:hypothetical protein